MDVSTAETGALSAGQGTAGSAVSPPLEAPSAPSSRHLLHGSAWLLVTLATCSLSGFAFWLLAARLDDPASVGRGAALLTSVLVINYATSMGLPVAVARYGVGPSAGASVLFSWALLFTAATSAIGGLVFLAVAPDAVIAPLWAWGPLAGTGLFLTTVIGTSLGVLVDVRLMAARRWSWVLFRVLAVNLIRLPLLWLRPDDEDGLWLFVLAAGLRALSGLVAAALVRQVHCRRRRLRPLPAHTPLALRYACVNYLSMLALQAPQFVLPLIVVLNVSSAENANFHVAWSATTIAFLVPHTIGQVLLVEGGRAGARVAAQAKAAIVTSFALTATISVAAIVFSDVLTALYGEAYRAAADLLPTLVGASVAWAATAICLAEARVREATASTIAISLAFGLAILVPAAVLTVRDGLDGAARAWLIGNLAAGALALLARPAAPLTPTRP